MIASDSLLLEMLEDRRLMIHRDNDTRSVQPASVDLHLGRHFKFWPPASTPVRYGDPVQMTSVTVAEGGCVTLPPWSHTLGETEERVSLSRGIAARVEGKSTAGRTGLGVHCTAGWIDPGFTGVITFELINFLDRPLEVPVGAAVSQLCVFLLDRPCARAYGSPSLGSRYQFQDGVTEAKPNV